MMLKMAGDLTKLERPGEDATDADGTREEGLRSLQICRSWNSSKVGSQNSLQTFQLI